MDTSFAGCDKLMVDATVLKNCDKGAYATIYRNEHGVFQGASAVMVEDQVTPEILEAMSFHEALALASDLNLRKVQVITDCMATVHHLKRPYLGESSRVIDDIKEKIKDF